MSSKNFAGQTNKLNMAFEKLIQYLLKIGVLMRVCLKRIMCDLKVEPIIGELYY